jgi:hypothetical protein
MVRRCHAYHSSRASFSLLLPAIAFAPPAHKRLSHHWLPARLLAPPNNDIPVYGERERSAARPAIRRATGMVARGTISAIPGFITAATMAAVSARAGPSQASGGSGIVASLEASGARKARNGVARRRLPNSRVSTGKSFDTSLFETLSSFSHLTKRCRLSTPQNLPRSIGVCKQRVSSIGLWRWAFTRALFQEPLVTSIG